MFERWRRVRKAEVEQKKVLFENSSSKEHKGSRMVLYKAQLLVL